MERWKIITWITALTILTAMLYVTTLPIPKAKAQGPPPGYESHPPIYIVGDAALDAFPNKTGSGTPDDPYIIPYYPGITHFAINASDPRMDPNAVAGIDIRGITNRCVIIRNCYVYDGNLKRNQGIHLEGIAPPGRNRHCWIKIENVIAVNNDPDIGLASSNNITIASCSLQGPAKDAICLYGGTEYFITIVNTRTTGTDYGVDGSSVRWLNITNCYFEGASGAGVPCVELVDVAYGILHNVTASSDGHYAFRIANSVNVNITGATAISNTGGFYIWGTSPATSQRITINGSAVEDTICGIYITGAGYVTVNNTVIGNVRYGVYVEDSVGITIDRCAFVNFTRDVTNFGVYARNSNYTLINRTSFLYSWIGGKTSTGVETSGCYYVYIQNSLFHNLSYAGVNFYFGGARYLFVDSCNFTQIGQYGVRNYDNNYTYVLSSTFTNVTKPGANSYGVFNDQGDYVYVFDCSFHNQTYGVYNNGGTNVTVAFSDFSNITDAGVYTSGGVDIQVAYCAFENITTGTGYGTYGDRAARVSIYYCNFTHVRYAVYNYYGYSWSITDCRFYDVTWGVYHGGSTTRFGWSLVSNCYFENPMSSGVFVRGDWAYCLNVTNNYVKNAAYGISAVVCRLFNIINNTFEGGGYGAMLTGCINMLISDSLFSQMTYGVFSQQASASYPAYNVTIAYNAFVDCDYGVFLRITRGTAKGWNYVHSNLFYRNLVGVQLRDINFTVVLNNYFKENGQHVSRVGSSYYDYFYYRMPYTNIVGGPEWGGNYWDDATGVDSDNDGFLDAYYVIDSSVDWIDYYPLAAYVEITSPSDGEILNSRTFNVTWDIPPIVTQVVGYNVYANGTFEGSAGQYDTSATVSLGADGWYNVTVVMQHWIWAGSRYWTFNYTDSVMVLVDTGLPSVVITSPTSGSYETDTVPVMWDGYDGLSSIDHYEIKLDGGSWIDVGLANVYVFSGLPEGSHTVTVRAYDKAGNYAEDSVTFTVDLTPPTVSNLQPSHTYKATNTVQITWTGSDNYAIDHYEVCVDLGRWVDVGLATSYTFVLEDGNHTVTVRAYDKAGNYAEASTWFVVDTTPPSASILSPEDDAWFNTTSVSISFDYFDAYLKSAQLYNGTAWVDVTGSYSYTCNFATDGDYAITLKVEDMAGNTQTVTVTIHVDTVAPSLNIQSPADGSYHATGDITIKWSGSDDRALDTYYLKWDDGPWIELGLNTQFSLSFSEGTHKVWVRAYDEAGNYVEKSVTFTVDWHSPELTFVEPSQEASFDVNKVTVKWNCTDLTPVTMYVRIDGGDWNAVSEMNYTFEGLSDGGHIVEVKAVDAAGNEALISLLFYVDTTAPTVSIKSPSEGAALTTHTVTVTWSGFDEVSGIDHYEIRIDGGDWINVGLATSYTFTELGAGSHTIEVKAVDALGHEQVAKVTFTIKGFPATITDILGILGLIGLILAIVILVMSYLAVRRKPKE